MPHAQENSAGSLSVLLFLLGMFLLASPFASWWLSVGAPWLTPWLLWGVLIGLAGLVTARAGHYDA